MEKAHDICNSNIQGEYEKYKDFGNQVYQEYEEVYKRMCGKLNESHLEPFAKILVEQENIVLKGQDELVKSVKQNLEKQLLEAVCNLWHSNSVSEALITLEICKQKFKAYEGHKWNLDAKTPRELTRHIRMRLKESRLRYLEGQINYQNTQLAEVMQENKILRQQFLDVKGQRTVLLDSINTFRKQIELAKPKVMELQLKMLSENDDNVETDIEAEKFEK